MHHPADRDCLELWFPHRDFHPPSSGHPRVYLHDPHLMKLSRAQAYKAQALWSWPCPSIRVESKGPGKTVVSFAAWLTSTYQQWHNSILRQALSNLHWDLLHEEPVSITAMHRRLWVGVWRSSLSHQDLGRPSSSPHQPEAQPRITGLLQGAVRKSVGSDPTIKTEKATVAKGACSSALLMELSQKERFNLF